MKKSVDMMGVPVISIAEGRELGIVKDLVINPAQGSVVALAIDDGKWYLGAKLLPVAAIDSWGEYAITTESSSNVLSIATAPELEELLEASVRVIGSKVLTKSGRIQGKVTEIIIEYTGKISCEMEDVQGETVLLPSQRIMTLGRDVIIITDSEDSTAPAFSTPVPTEAPYVSSTPIITSPSATPLTAPPPVAAVNTVVPEIADSSSSSKPETITEEPVSKEETASEEPNKKFDEKHRKYLLGKKASRRIETDNGVTIVEQGGEITEEVLQKAKLAGKFVELSMNIQ